MVKKPTDIVLIDMLRSSSKHEYNKALSFIYSTNYGKVENYILKNSGSAADAEDVFQDGLIAFYEQVVKGKFKGSSTISTYLFAICKNLWFKNLRKGSRKNETFGTEIEMRDDGKITIDKIIQDEETNSLMSLIGQLGKSSQQILRLYYYEQKKMSEIAKIMNLESPEVAKNKKYRCITKLRELASLVPAIKSFNR